MVTMKMKMNTTTVLDNIESAARRAALYVERNEALYTTKKQKNKDNAIAGGMRNAVNKFTGFTDEHAATMLVMQISAVKQLKSIHEFNKTYKRSNGNQHAYQTKAAENERAAFIEGQTNILEVLSRAIVNGIHPQELKDKAAEVLQLVERHNCGEAFYQYTTANK